MKRQTFSFWAFFLRIPPTFADFVPWEIWPHHRRGRTKPSRDELLQVEFVPNALGGEVGNPDHWQSMTWLSNIARFAWLNSSCKTRASNTQGWLQKAMFLSLGRKYLKGHMRKFKASFLISSKNPGGSRLSVIKSEATTPSHVSLRFHPSDFYFCHL